jgi:hypothetical protein
MVKTTVVNIRKEKCDVYIGRPNKWGNPFNEKEHGSRTEVIKKYKEWLINSPDAEEVRNSLYELEGKTLGCWCKPKACHGDVLAEIIDNGLLEYMND